MLTFNPTHKTPPIKTHERDYERAYFKQYRHRVLEAAALEVERAADEVMAIAETTDPRVKRAIYNLASRVRRLAYQ